MEGIRTCRNINRILMKQNDSNELLSYRYFCLLKNMDNESGFVPYNQANKASTLLLNKNFTLKVISRIPNISKYMTVTPKGVFLTSWRNLWEYFDVTPTTWVMIPYKAFQGVAEFRMYMYAGYVKNTIQSRQTIEENTGVPKTTQIRYEKKLGIPKQHRALEHNETDVIDGLALGTINPASVFTNKGKYYQQLPNQYMGNVELNTSRIQREFNASRQAGHKQQSRRNSKKIHQPTNYMLNNKLVHAIRQGAAIVPTGYIMGKIMVCSAVEFGFELS